MILAFSEPLGPTNIFKPALSFKSKSDKDLKPLTSILVIIYVVFFKLCPTFSIRNVDIPKGGYVLYTLSAVLSLITSLRQKYFLKSSMML